MLVICVALAKCDKHLKLPLFCLAIDGVEESDMAAEEAGEEGIGCR